MNFNSFEYPNELQVIFDKLEKYKLKPIIVGGYVRDFFLEKKSKDIDIEIYGLSKINTLIEILAEFGDVNIVGKSFGVCKLGLKNFDIDFSLPRIDSKISAGHKGFDVITHKELDFETAASRRDFTINTIGYDVQNKNILDPFDALIDLENKTLKMVDKKSFIEDPLRVLRAMGMCARFELNIEHQTLDLCKQMIRNNLLDELPKERVYEEFKKLFLKAQKPSLGFLFLKTIGADKFFDGLDFSEPSFSQTLYSLDRFQTNKTNEANTNIKLMLVLLLYKQSEEKIHTFLNKLSNEKNLAQSILQLSNNLKVLMQKQDRYTLKKIATQSKISELCLLLDALNLPTKSIYTKAEKFGILDEPEPMLIMGKDLIALGLSPSKEFSKILSQAYEAQLHSEFASKDDALIWLDKFLSQV